MKYNTKYIMTLDEGTSSLRTLIINKQGKVVSISRKEFTQIFPESGWVEQDANEILGAQLSTIKEAKRKAGIKSVDIAAIGITNQRETIVLWDKTTGLPVYNAIVWQDLRTSKYCEELEKKGYGELIARKTGLLINPYFSGTKIRWVLKNVNDAKKVYKKGNLLAGTIDTWLIWNLTKGEVFATDYSNASRTLLFNIKTGEWDDEILKIMGIPKSILPEIKPSSGFFGNVDPKIFSRSAKGIVPITGVIGDQQSSLFGQLAVKEGDIKSTYGTGNFILANTGKKLVYSKNKLLTTIAWKIGNQPITYALEGSVFVSGSALHWLRDGLGILYDTRESDIFANFVDKEDNQNIVFVPALSGLGAPYWDTSARGAIFGIERGTRREHIVKATLESIAFQSNDLIQTMSKDMKKKIRSIKVDGGASKSNYLMQFLSSISQKKIVRPNNIETTAMGAAYMAGLAIGYWESIKEIQQIAKVGKVYSPKISNTIANKKLKNWKEAVKRVRNWKH